MSACGNLALLSLKYCVTRVFFVPEGIVRKTQFDDYHNSYLGYPRGGRDTFPLGVLPIAAGATGGSVLLRSLIGHV